MFQTINEFSIIDILDDYDEHTRELKRTQTNAHIFKSYNKVQFEEFDDNFDEEDYDYFDDEVDSNKFSKIDNGCDHPDDMEIESWIPSRKAKKYLVAI